MVADIQAACRVTKIVGPSGDRYQKMLTILAYIGADDKKVLSVRVVKGS